MNLIGEHHHPVLPAKLADLRQRILIPNFPHRIVGITEDHERSLGIGQLSLQIREIDPVSAAVVFQAALQDLPSIIENRVEKNIIDRCLDQHLLPGGRELPDRTGNGGDHAGTKNQPILFHSEIMPPPPPAGIGLIPLLRNDGITKNAMKRPV